MNIDSIESAKKLDECLRKIPEIGPLHISLEEVWKVSENHPSGNRIFPSVLDIHLNVARLNIEIASIARRINADMKEPTDLNCLTDPIDLKNRLDLFGDSTAFVLRYRALWDKIMGVVVLLLDPKKYQNFCGAKSRKKCFCKFLENKGGSWPSYAKGVSETIQTFDDRFRTAEAHGSGRIRKMAFNRISSKSNPLEDLLWATNSLNDQMLIFERIFKYLAEQGA
ncbi:MAG: hypothetical protein RBS57_07740 [Desulforhabdus sp.]|nr:hypothetical protein [Desulforhabdus sp.]